MPRYSHWLSAIVLTAALASGAYAQDRTPSGTLRPDDLRWTANPAVPPGSEIALLVGAPARTGPYTLRIRFVANHRVMPHSHPDNRTYTVLSGTFHIGFGEKFEHQALIAYPAGSFVVVPRNVRHFQWSGREPTIVQVAGQGPTATVYVDSLQDPRRR
jgi:hypothetical protein